VVEVDVAIAGVLQPAPLDGIDDREDPALVDLGAERVPRIPAHRRRLRGARAVDAEATAGLQRVGNLDRMRAADRRGQRKRESRGHPQRAGTVADAHVRTPAGGARFCFSGPAMSTDLLRYVSFGFVIPCAA